MSSQAFTDAAYFKKLACELKKRRYEILPHFTIIYEIATELEDARLVEWLNQQTVCEVETFQRLLEHYLTREYLS